MNTLKVRYPDSTTVHQIMNESVHESLRCWQNLVNETLAVNSQFPGYSEETAVITNQATSAAAPETDMAAPETDPAGSKKANKQSRTTRSNGKTAKAKAGNEASSLAAPQ